MLNNTEEIIFKMIIPRYVNVSKLKQDQIYLYKYKESCEHFILLLEGSLIIEAGIERTLFVVKQFDHFGVKALLGIYFISFYIIINYLIPYISKNY
jgi:hypothetical protein